MRRGFTLLEVLTAIAIIAIVAAIAFPVIAKAKDSAFKAKSVSNMRQVHLALEIYSQEHNGSTEGTMEAMGLPPWPSTEFLGNTVKDMYPPMRPSEAWHSYMYMPIPSGDDRRTPTWEEYTTQVGPAAIVICDPFFNPRSTDDYPEYWKDPFVQKFVMGITVSGSLVKRTRAGYLTLGWWMD